LEFAVEVRQCPSNLELAVGGRRKEGREGGREGEESKSNKI
jgi:hypothetical protein